MPTDPVTAAPERLPGVDEPALTIDLGFGRWMIDRGTYADVPCLYLEPAPVPGPPLERAPEFTSIRQLLPGPDNTPDDPKDYAAALTAPAPAAAVTRPSLEEARTAARAWIEAYGINTERYTRHGGDHPMMETLPEAFQAYAAAQAVAAVARPSLEEVTKLVDAGSTWIDGVQE